MTDSIQAVATTIVIMEYIPDVFSMTYDVGRGTVVCVESNRNPMNCDEKKHHDNVSQSASENRYYGRKAGRHCDEEGRKDCYLNNSKIYYQIFI